MKARPNRKLRDSTGSSGSLLLTMPLWLNAVGGYTQLGTLVLVMALAATALNFLLGFTGMLSFGHAAYFGLGAYGAGMTIKYLVPNTLLGMAVGVAAAMAAAAMVGRLIVHLRGIYFAMVTIAFGQVFYFIAFRWNNVTGGDDGLSNWHPHADRFRLRQDRHSRQSGDFLLLRAVFLRALAGRDGVRAALAVRPDASGDSRERAPRALPRHSRWTATSGCRG